jgi:lipopolysaccharide/colanic/teichoic acid biosynthesis glycosyltransferase
MIAYFISVLFLPEISKYLSGNIIAYITPTCLLVFSLFFVVSFLFDHQFNKHLYLIGFVSSIIIFSVITSISKKQYDYYQFGTLDFNGIKKINDYNQALNLKNSAVIYDCDITLTKEQNEFLQYCFFHQIKIIDNHSWVERNSGRINLADFSSKYISALSLNNLYLAIKRLWESILILVTLPITLPIMLVTFIVIKLQDGGPAFFCQQRIGQNGKPLSLFATEEQARITKFGRFIRKFRIDELPQLFNVLLGDMSLIGPRPEQPSFVSQFDEEIPFYAYRHKVKPGITGWAQVVQGYADDTDSTREKLSYDLFYIKHLSLSLDINIVLRTLYTMCTGFGAK